VASANYYINFCKSKPTNGSPGDMYFDGTDLVVLDSSGMPRPVATATGTNRTPKQMITEVVAWCPECTTEYPLPGLVEDYYCYHHMVPEESYRIRPEDIRNAEEFVPIKKHQCLIFEVHTEVY